MHDWGVRGVAGIVAGRGGVASVGGGPIPDTWGGQAGASWWRECGRRAGCCPKSSCKKWPIIFVK